MAQSFSLAAIAVATMMPTPSRLLARSTDALRLRCTQTCSRRLPGVSTSTSAKPTAISTSPTSP